MRMQIPRLPRLAGWILLPALALAGCDSGSSGGGAPSVADATPPEKVPNLTATAPGASGRIDLVWIPSISTDASGYRITWTPPGGDPQPVDVTPGTATGTTISGLTDGTQYTFSVFTLDAAGNVSTSAATAQVTPTGIPPDTIPPNNVTAFTATSTGFTGQVSLSWTASISTDVSAYEVTWTPADGEPQPKLVTPLSATGTVVSGLTTGTSYVFSVVAVDTSGNRALPPPVTATTTPIGTAADTTPPADVTNLAAEATGFSGEIRLTWSPSTSSDIASYEVTWTPLGGDTQPKLVTPGAATGTTVSGLTDGTLYTFTIKAIDTSGNKTSSQIVSASPGDAALVVQTIPSGGIYPGPLTAIFNVGVPGTITYSINGADPTTTGPLTWTAASAPIVIDPAVSGTNFMRVKYRLVTATSASTVRTDVYEIFPTAVPTQRFFKFAGMRRSRIGHTATPLETASTNRDDVVVVGGYDGAAFNPANFDGSSGALTDDGERFNFDFEHFEPAVNATSTVVTGGVPGSPRWWHAAAPLANGRVLITGGQTGAGKLTHAVNPYSPSSVTNHACIYDGEPTSPTYNRFLPAGGNLTVGRAFHTATRLFNGDVVLIGGMTADVIVDPLTARNATPSQSSIELPTGTLAALPRAIKSVDWVEMKTGGAAGQITAVTSTTRGIAPNPDIIAIEKVQNEIHSGDQFKVISYNSVGTLERFDSTGTPVPGSVKNLFLYRWGHASTRLDDGRVLITGGFNDAIDDVFSDQLNEIYDHSTNTVRVAGLGSGVASNSARLLFKPRCFHTATLLKDGKVLVAGGLDRNYTLFHGHGIHDFLLNSAEIYDPVTDTMRKVAGTMSQPRCFQSATLLCDGRVLLVGGYTGIVPGTPGFPVITQTADLFDPVTETFSLLVPNDLREHNQSLTLSDCRALIMGGGISAAGIPSDLAELFLPRTNQFVATAHGVGGERTYGAASTLLMDGRRVLITGGETDVRMGKENLVAGPMLATAEIYNLSTIKSTFTSNPMSVPRRFHTSTLLQDLSAPGTVKGSWHGKVLITGGETDSPAPVGRTRTCDLFDPSTNQFTPTGQMAAARWNHTATLLLDGRVLVTGGGTTDNPLPSAELWVPSAGTWVNAATNLTRGRTKHTATLLPNKPSVPANIRGKVLIAGGNTIFDTTAELFNPSTNVFEPLPSADVMNAGRRGHGAALRSYTAGFTAFTNGSATVRGFQTRWNDPSILAHLRPAAGDQIASLPDGTLYQIASVDADLDGAGAEDASLTLTAPFAGASSQGYQPYTIFKGDVLFAGGEVLSTAVDTFSADTLIAAAAAGTFETSAPMAEGRHSLTLIATADGQILVAGGLGGTANTALRGGRLFTPQVPLPFTGAFRPPPPASETPFDAGGVFSFHYDARPANGIVLIFRSHSAQAFLPLAGVDVTPPVLTCTPNQTMEATSAAGATVTYPPSTAVDTQDPAPTLTYSQPSGTLFPVGATLVTVASADAAGNASMCVFTVTVQDTISPVVTCPAPVLVQSSSVVGAVVAYTPAIAVDTVDASPTIVYSQASGTLFPIGTSTVTATATDDAGNSASCSFPVVVAYDTTPPDTSFTSTPPSVSNSSTANFSFTSTEAGSTFQRSLDGGAFVAVASSETLAGLTDAIHTYQVRAVDTAGNIDPTPAAFSWTVDVSTSPAEVSNLTAQATGVTGEIQLSWTPSPSTDVVNYRVTWAPADAGFQPRIVIPGTATGTIVNSLNDCSSYTFTVQSVDANTNTSAGKPTPLPVAPGNGSLVVEAAPSGGAYPSARQVIFNFIGAGTVHYTINGADPTCAEPLTWTTGAAPIVIDTTGSNFKRLKYRLVSGIQASTVRTEIYEFFPVGVPTQRLFKFSGMRVARTGHTVTRLVTAAANRDDVAVIGGMNRALAVAGLPVDAGLPVASGERFNANFAHFEDAANLMTAVAGAPPARWFHAAAPLPAGRVLVSGGQTAALGFTNPGGAFTRFSPRDLTATAVIYDGEPASGTYNSFIAAGGPMGTARFLHTATRMYNDQVLFAGGQSGVSYTGPPIPCTNNNPTSSSLSMAAGTLLPLGISKGDLVEIVGGLANGEVGVIDDFILSGTGDSLTVTGLNNNVSNADAFLILRGRGLSTAELFSGAGAPAGATGGMTLNRFGHTATLLDDGRVLIAGGANDFSGTTTGDLTPEIYSRVTNTFTSAGGGTTSAQLAVNRFFHTATKLKDGKVLIAGGIDRGDGIFHSAGLRGSIQSSADLYDPVTETSTPVGPMSTERFFHSATLLDDGRVLIVGGISDIVFGVPTIDQTADVYNPVTRAFTALNTNDPRGHNQSVTLSDGRALIMGGSSRAVVPSDLAELFLPLTNQFTATAHGIAAERTYGTAVTALVGGRKLLLSGGQTQLAAGSVLASAEVYDISSIATSPAGNTMAVGRRFHTSTLLLDRTTAGPTKGTWHGKVLIAGGENVAGGTSTCELYDPATNLFLSSGAMGTPRWNHTATLLFDGRVLATGGGGTDSPLPTAEIYQPATAQWTPTVTPMSRGRNQHAAVLIPNKPSVAAGLRGKVLLTGGNDILDTTAEVFNPNTNGFEALASGSSMGTGRRGHGAAVRAFTAGFAKFSTGLTDVRGFQSRWNDATLAAALRPAVGDVIACLNDGTLYQIAAVLADPDGAGPEDGAITLAAAYTGPATLGYQPYVVFKDDVLVAGGEVLSTGVDLFAGATGVFGATAPMGAGRYTPTVVVAPDGRILVAGGTGGETSGEAFDPAAGAFSALLPFSNNGRFAYHASEKTGGGIILHFRSHSVQAFFQE